MEEQNEQSDDVPEEKPKKGKIFGDPIADIEW